ncbi:MAG TPA: hypothetical protein VJP45_02895, partial [Candidatus Limnocylindria bacterium]|nr:hypothetical protein [Candidatus Limnocylindria bacterium]
GGHPKLHEAAEKIVTAVRSIVPPTGVAIAPEMRPAAPAPMPLAPTTPAAAAATTPAVAPTTPVVAPTTPLVAPPARPLAQTPPPATPDSAPLPAMRLLPKVPFRFCIHTDGERQWMQLEGGTADLVPTAVRVMDASENVVDTRLCIPIATGERGHARIVADEAPGVAWVVVAVPKDVVIAIDSGRPSPFTFQAKVDDDWVALDLVDTGCRLGGTRAAHAAS